MESDRDRCYRAFLAHDRRLDGRMFAGVVTTGVYCRPICPVRPAKLENTRFFPCAAAAEAAGFRPCRRCRPETAPGTPAWMGTSAVVARACRLIGAGTLDDMSLEVMAQRLGLGSRQLRRLFARHLGASPSGIARARRVHFARALIDQTDLPMTTVALSAGFRSIRQFNHTFRTTFRTSPGVLRRTRRGAPADGDGIALRLAYRPPLAWEALLAFLRVRATPGVEAVSGDGYRRTIEVDGAPGLIDVRPDARAAHLLLRVVAPSYAGLLPIVERVRRLFDLDADPDEVARRLRTSDRLRPLLRRRPGLRVPGAWDGFELAVRAVLGQQVTVRGATTLAGRLVAAFGTPVELGDGMSHLFPGPRLLAQADVARIGLPRRRAETIRALAAAVAQGDLVLDPATDLAATVARLEGIGGIGPWTAQYIAMRALGEPDAFPAGDLGLRRALANGAGPVPARELTRLADGWRPWRAYAAMYLWQAAR